MKNYPKKISVLIFILLTFSALAVLSSSSSRVLAQFSPHAKVNDDSTEYDQLLRDSYSQVAIKGNTVYSVWQDNRSGGEI